MAKISYRVVKRNKYPYMAVINSSRISDWNFSTKIPKMEIWLNENYPDYIIRHCYLKDGKKIPWAQYRDNSVIEFGAPLTSGRTAGTVLDTKLLLRKKHTPHSQ